MVIPHHAPGAPAAPAPVRVLRDRPGWTVEHLVDRLRSEHRRLAELTRSDRSVAGTFALSYRDLPADQRRMFRLLGLHPGADIEPHAAAALAGTSVLEAEQLLEQLVDANLLADRATGRYVQHDLLRAHAAGLAAEQPEPAALDRVFDHYGNTAEYDRPEPTIGTARQAAAIAPIGDPKRGRFQLELAKALRMRSIRRENDAGLDEAIDTHQLNLRTLPGTDPIREPVSGTLVKNLLWMRIPPQVLTISRRRVWSTTGGRSRSRCAGEA